MRLDFNKRIKKQEALIIIDFWREFVEGFTDSSEVSFCRTDSGEIDINVAGVSTKPFNGGRYIKKYSEVKKPDKSLLDMAGEKNYRMIIEKGEQ